MFLEFSKLYKFSFKIVFKKNVIFDDVFLFFSTFFEKVRYNEKQKIKDRRVGDENFTTII